ncbi:P2 family phage major capsid protein [Luteibacter sp. 1214]|uniref:phage major capsid protein, P2 family n=1 Tax=Luteibacter sp. 1214 TaxID=2817735 RepID=UPI00285BB3EC|nr:phage major capsid protein, P2 family [Luteibacter sp. 1214]MDR6642757.1 P2 family phage major capsid protein [Luteibacter sp. 1214]
MLNPTRLAFAAFCAQLATLNSVAHATEKFAVSPTIQQRLETRIQESSDYLSLINMIGVTEKSGAKLGLGVTGPVASRTDTTQKDRNPRDVSSLTEQLYNCVKTDFDTAFPYALLDAWAKFPDFQNRLRDAIIQRQALDRLTIGWNGKSIAPATDLAANPLLQDVNKGWLQNLRDGAPENVMATGKKQAGEVRVGPGGDYETLDALVYDIIVMLDPWHQQNTGLRAHVGRKLLHDKYFPVVNRQQGAQDELASQLLVSQKSIGGLPGLVVPFFPDNAVLVTIPKNLSLYYQDGARRRQVMDEPKRDRIANYESSNDAYVVEDLGAAALVENIVIGKWA